VKLYNGKLPIFEEFGVHKQIKAAFGKQVNMRSGGYLIIEHTEAMHVVDVNSGNRKGAENQEENALATNMEAADELARVLRLRDMGGIIAVDFIDLASKENQKKLFEHMRAVMKDDKAKHHVLPPSKFGVIEITRQRVRPETEIKTAETCPSCNGTGEIQAAVLITDEIDGKLAYIEREFPNQKLILKVHPFIEAFLRKNFFASQRKWYRLHKKWIKIQPDTTLHLMQYRFIKPNGIVLGE
jgi:ribonuclease G